MARKLLAFAFALALVSAASAAGAESAPLSDAIRAPRPAGGEYFGLYILGRKVGYQFMHLSFAPGSRDKLRMVDEVVMRAEVGGRRVERAIKEIRTYEAKPGGRLLSFVIDQHGDGGNQVMEGTATATGVTVIRKRPGLPNEILTLPPPRETVEDADQVRVALLRKQSVSGLLMDSMDLKQYRVTTTPLPTMEVTAGGVKIQLLRASTVSEKEQVPVQVSLTPDGKMQEMKFGSQLEARAEPEAVAKRVEVVDLFGLTRVIMPREPPPGARTVPGQMTLVVSRLPERFLRDTDRQKFRRLDRNKVEVVITARPPAPGKRRTLPLADPAGGENLRSDLAVESERPEIKQKAKQILAGETDALAAAQKISGWVHRNMESAYGVSADRATDVLRQMKGDCTEHSLLAVTLLRASGIPAKRVDGLIYQKDGNGGPALMWHEWVAAYVGEWVQMDPTWDQPVADATHFAVGEETTAEIAPLIGELQILEVR